METETIHHRLNEKQRDFFKDFCNYTGAQIYIYGSIHRIDYIPGKSDIDVDIFTNNVDSLLQKICMFLHIKKTRFQRSIFKIKNNLVYGSKTMFTNEEKDIKIEISVFDEKYKSLVLSDHYNGIFLPLYITIPLYIIKVFYYVFGIITKQQYKRAKLFLMNADEIKFVSID